MTRDGNRRYDGPVKRAAEYFIQNPPSCPFFTEEPMDGHCTFHSGGKAEVFVIPRHIQDLIDIRRVCRNQGFPLFILGGGANILVSDRGIPGVTLSMEGLDNIRLENNDLICGAGTTVNALVQAGCDYSLTGLEFLNRLPGSVGGALYMNARCYGSEIADVLSWAEVLTDDDEVKIVPMDKNDWGYKISPFQKKGLIITGAAFRLSPGDRDLIKGEMSRIAASRLEKGHFKAPSAGSTFKNDRKFGKPSGQIIDECGLKGFTRGGAAVSSWHGNILINKNRATSEDISELIVEVQKRVKEATGFDLEPEVIRVGDWD